MKIKYDEKIDAKYVYIKKVKLSTQKRRRTGFCLIVLKMGMY
jgi:uncharacterized protein YuzE